MMTTRSQSAWGMCGHENVSTAVLRRHRSAWFWMRQHSIELQHRRPRELAQFPGEEADLLQPWPGAHRSGIRAVTSYHLHRHGPDRQRDHTFACPAARPAHRHDEQVHGRHQSQCSILDPADDGLSEYWPAGNRRLESELDHGARCFLQSAEAVARPLSVRDGNAAAQRPGRRPQRGRRRAAVPV
jgi:hypothetical protein